VKCEERIDIFCREKIASNKVYSNKVCDKCCLYCTSICPNVCWIISDYYKERDKDYYETLESIKKEMY